MKLLHTSDWHIGRSLFEFSLLDDQRAFFEQLCQIIEEQKIDALLISGDLYDRSMPSAQAVSLLDEMFTTLIRRDHLPILAISGNHDSPRRVSYGSYLFEQSGLYLAGQLKPQLQKVTLFDSFGKINFFLLPYFVPAQVRLMYEDSSIHTSTQALEAIIEHNRDIICPDERNVLLAHGFFMNQHHESEENTPLLPQTCGSETSVGTSDLTDLSCCEELFDYVALGHLHSAQRAGSDTMRYSGSPLKYSVDEAKNSKSVTVVEISEKGKISFSLIPLIPHRDLRLICGTMEELCKQENKSEDYVFAQIISDGPVLNAMSRLREVYPHTLGLSFCQSVQQNTPEFSLDLAALEPMELFSRFYRQITGQQLDKEKQDIVLQALKKAGKDREEEE